MAGERRKHYHVQDSLGGKLVKTAGLVNLCLNKKLREYSIPVTPEQWTLLAAIYFTPGVTQAEAALKIRKDRTNVTRILDVLEKNGLVKRADHPQDRRSYRLFLTDAGKTIAERIFPVIEETNRTLCEDLGPDQLDLLSGILDRISLNLQGVL